MNETTRTLTFAGIAVATLIAAFVADRASQPTELTGYENVGEEFYPDFTDPTQAKSLRVVSYNEDSATLKVFNVEFKDGVWKIPSHHDYPADAEAELAETAASLVGVVRGALESRRKSDHERFGVIDPLDESNTNLKGRGQRLTLSQEGGTPLVDFIIGKQIPDQPNEYYVRKVDEDSVYRTKLNVDLSSEFSDWIEPDLLKVERDRLVEIIVNKYSIDERQRRIVNRELSTLTRKKSTDPWELEGLNKETEKLNTADVNQMINTLGDLKIQGIRPKPTGIAQELKKSGSLRLDPIDFVDLQSKGFILASDPQGNQQLVSNEGEVIAATNQGVVYSLYFGEIFTGSALDIEVGNSAKKKDEKSKEEKEKTPAATDAKEPEKKADEKTDEGALKTSRYLFVTVSFDPSFIGDPPQKPEEPQKPADPKAEKPAPDKKEADKKAETKPADKKEDSAKPAEKTGPVAEYEIAMKKYQSELKTYEKQLKEYDDKVVKGNELVQKLNERFADWYYVISANSFETLRMSRKALIEPIEKSAPPQTEPAVPPKGTPATKPTDPAKPSPTPAKKPAPDESGSTAKPEKPAEKPATEKSDDKPKTPETDAKGTATPEPPKKN
ncbi:DUF4340 domain-containing protein [uncultured Gimesia sp.]|uniref:DUF4340 domain-containing protein n=1 Tax=uncultured Gimesia sp. TaxID=1678688 RepID=UPI00262D5969|nr:DUF4340 domain-containing protein [uncultured Gimesia sp.]